MSVIENDIAEGALDEEVKEHQTRKEKMDNIRSNLQELRLVLPHYASINGATRAALEGLILQVEALREYVEEHC